MAIIDISILIVNYHSGDLLEKCLPTLFEQTGATFEIIVIDNASQDNSLALLEKYKDKITLIKSNQNLGFGRGNNEAFKQSHGRYILLLNPDTACYTNLDLHHFVTYMDQHPEVGLLGSHLIDEKGKESPPKKEYPGEKYVTSPFKHLPGEIAWLLGACMCIRRELYEKLHGFDEDYFLYGEDTDLCLRIRQAGFKIAYADHITIKHIGRGSERKTGIAALWQKKQHGLFLFLKKHYRKEQIQQIILHEQRQAKKHLRSIKIKNFFLPWKNFMAKRERYQTIVETSQEFLKSF